MSNSLVTNSGKNLMLSRMFQDTETPISQFKIGTGTTEPSVADTDIESVISGWNSGSDTANFVSGFPTFDTANKEVTVRGRVTATQANGNMISEVATFNSDASEDIDVHATFTGISKTSSEEIVFIITNRIE